MRHVLLPLLLLTLIVSFCLFSAIWVTKAIDQTEYYLNQAIVYYGAQRKDATERYITLASDYWTEKQLFLGMVLEHEEVDEISGSFARLQSYASSEDRDDFLSNCAALQTDLSHIREMEWPYIQNIL